MSSRRAPLLVLALGLLGSQAGHLLAFWVRFGSVSAQIQSSGAHAYFPAVAKIAVGVAAVIVIGGLFVIGLARSIAGRPLRPHQEQLPFISLLAALFTFQLTCFAVQETVETYLAGAPAGSPAVLLLWGTLGQLPVAAVSALALRWLLARFAAAVIEIRSAIALVEAPPRLVPATAPVARSSDQPLLLSRVTGSWLAKRGPPSLRRPSSS